VEYEIKMTSKGQLTIPKEIRDKLGLKAGDFLRAQVEKGHILLKPLPHKNADRIFKEYVAREGKNAPGLAQVREKTEKLKIDPASLVRRVRDEESAGD